MILCTPEPIPKYDDDGKVIPYATRLEAEVGMLRGVLERIADRPSGSGCGMCHREDPDPCADWCVRAKALAVVKVATVVGVGEVDEGKKKPEGEEAWMRYCVEKVEALEGECVRLVREGNRKIAAALREAEVGTDVVPLLTSDVVGEVLGRRRVDTIGCGGGVK